jgi:hypothetical protein
VTLASTGEPCCSCRAPYMYADPWCARVRGCSLRPRHALRHAQTQKGVEVSLGASTSHHAPTPRLSHRAPQECDHWDCTGNSCVPCASSMHACVQLSVGPLREVRPVGQHEGLYSLCMACGSSAPRGDGNVRRQPSLPHTNPPFVTVNCFRGSASALDAVAQPTSSYHYTFRTCDSGRLFCTEAIRPRYKKTRFHSNVPKSR